jgi:outer membrane protein assembly factor BamC
VPETVNVKSRPAVTPTRLAVLALAAALAGCSSLEGLFSGDKVDYRNAAAKAKPLEVPPDLTQLSHESRYQSQGGVVSASAAPGPGAAAQAGGAGGTGASPVPAPATATVALTEIGTMHVERQGQQRWLVVPAKPEQLWPQVRGFWEQRGFVIESENAEAGVLETKWSEDRAKLPDDVVRNTLGKLLGSLYDTGERDRYRTRIERTATGSEIYISHRGAEEVYTNDGSGGTVWRLRPNDPQLEAEMLSHLMVALGVKDPAAARAAVAAASPAAVSTGPATVTAATATPAAADPTARARPLAAAATLEVDEPFDRAWRRVGLALDRGGFTVEDRDRAAGTYYVRYVDPKSAGKEEPGWWARLFGDKANPQAAVRYRIAVKANGEKTLVSVLTSAGTADSGEIGKRIAAQLVTELR